MVWRCSAQKKPPLHVHRPATIVQWPSGNFKGHLDIENIWVFIAFPVSMVSIESKKRNLPFASLGENFLRGF